MIDTQVFSSGITLLCNHYDRRLQPEVMRIWKEHLDSALTTEQFQQAVKTTLLDNRFFPTAKELVEAVKGNSEAQALQEWDRCLEGSSRADRSVVDTLTPAGKFALKAIGGITALGQVETSDIKWTRKEFISAWKSWSPSVAPALPPAGENEVILPSLNVDPRMRKLTQKLVEKFSIDS